MTSSAGVINTATVVQGRVVRAPLASLNTVVQPAGTVVNTQRPHLLPADKTAPTAGTTLQAHLTGRGSGVIDIDLTDEDEGNYNFVFVNNLWSLWCYKIIDKIADCNFRRVQVYDLTV